jgi:hypothetical protein
MASGVNFGTQQYFGFDPRTIPGCGLWLDAADARTLTTSGGGNVTQWADKSGVGANMTPVGTQSNATIQTNYQNGLSAVNFAGINVYRTVDGTGVYPSDVYILVALKSLVRMDVIAIGTTTGGGNFNSLTFGEHTALRWHNGSDFFNRTPLMVSPTNETSTSLLLMNWSLANNNFVIRRNGIQLVSTTSYTYTLTAPSSIQIGFRHPELTSTTLPLNAYIAEVLTYNRQLGLAERQQVEGYLAWKWALNSSLATSHPYRYVPPIMRIFQPVDLPGGALLWLDAADTRTITGSPVTQWTDKSGRGSNAVTGLGSVVAGTAINSLNTLRFGLNTTLNLSNFVMPTAQTSLFYIIRGITSNANTSQGTGYFIFSRTTDNFLVYTGNQQFFSFQNTPAGRSYNAVMGPGGERNWGNLPVPAFFNATSVVSITGISYSSSNGLALPQVAGGTISNTVFTASTYQISSSRNIGDVNTYDLGELVVCDGTVSIPAAQQMEGYLAWKWGVQRSLPTTHPYYNALPSTPLFTPAQLSGLVLWMDPTDITTLTLSGSSVTQWRDKSATGAIFNTVNGNPVYTTSLINGRPGIDLTNATGFISSATQTLTSSLTMAMILVVKSGIGAWGSFFTHGSRDLDIALERNSISAGTTLQFQTANDNSGANLTFTTDQVSLYLGTMTTGTSRFFERFGGKTTTTTTATNSSTITVGLQTIRIGRSDVGENCNSFIGEIVYYNRVLSTQERQQLEAYLAWKWGLQDSLPSTHPYSNFRP